MTGAQQHTQTFTAAKLARLERLCGRFPVLSSEKRQDYEELLICLLEAYWPRSFLGERLIKYLADEEWEVARYKRHKIFLIERRFQAGLAFQADREKATREDKAVLAKRLHEQPPSGLILPEEALEGVIAQVDAMLLRPAQELDHARALEVGIVYFQHLDRLLNAAIARRNAILADIARCDYLFDPTLGLSVPGEEAEGTALLAQVHTAGNGAGSEMEGGNAQGDKVAPPLAPSQGGSS
jgi:hypothetical protein